MEVQALVALVLGIVIVLFVPVLVWATVIAGLYQIVREKVRESHPLKIEPAQEAHHPIGSN